MLKSHKNYRDDWLPLLTASGEALPPTPYCPFSAEAEKGLQLKKGSSWSWKNLSICYILLDVGAWSNITTTSKLEEMIQNYYITDLVSQNPFFGGPKSWLATILSIICNLLLFLFSRKTKKNFHTPLVQPSNSNNSGVLTINQDKELTNLPRVTMIAHELTCAQRVSTHVHEHMATIVKLNWLLCSINCNTSAIVKSIDSIAQPYYTCTFVLIFRGTVVLCKVETPYETGICLW